LISKYAAHDAMGDDDPIAPVIAYREQIQAEIEKLRGEDDDLAGIDQQVEVMQEELDRLAAELRTHREAAAKKLAPQVEKQFKDLGMADAKLRVEFSAVNEDEVGAAVGRDAVEMLVRTNPGQPARPLRKIASGGELSRIMLAIKGILAGSDRTSVLVFDEIDANIGGRLGTVIGQKLRHLANGGNTKQAGGHQVLCVTHLPQIAAFGDCHLRIRKSVEGKGAKAITHTSVDLVTGKQRVDELAEMLAGTKATATTRKQARELMQAAQ
jgi:DNA repair protein RecN (Recombination protein N)